MEVDPTPGGDKSESAPLARLTHRHRNQIQNMRSLVSLFGRDMPEGICRDAFADIGARFEALTQTDTTIGEDATVETDFADFAGRIVEMLDRKRLHSISIDGAALSGPARDAETMRHLLTEMTIALVRRGLPANSPGAGEISVWTDADGVVVMRVAAAEASFEAPAAQSRDLGWTIAQSLAGHLGATLERPSTQPLVMEARIPATGDGR